jgi:hypothetical protein
MPVQVPVGSAPPGGTLVQVPWSKGTPQLWQDGQRLEPQQKPLVQKRGLWH